ncbi:MAG: VWA domain-containing protein, partial [Planctomycetes bacterium]|nr:VWA domain-containing protein [Planctomycetota bacterium]
MLWGMALGGIPILIHLLHRRRYIETSWAAMRFLIAAVEKQSRRMRLEQLLLLLIRTLILVLVAVALARPTSNTTTVHDRTEGPRHRILVIDGTLSMGYSTGESRCFERAQQIARRIVESAQQGDAFNLVRIGNSLPRVLISRPSFDPNSVIDEIEQVSLLDERVDLSTVLSEIDLLTKLLPEIDRKEIFFITDLQSATWTPEDSTESGRIRTLLKGLASRAKLTF